jgi:ribosomal protein S18 acetylase RimI-like enzyme
MTTIRRIRVNEAPAIRELIREATREAAARFPEDRIAISEQGLSNLETHHRLGAVHQDVMTFVAVDGDEIVGFVDAEVRHGRSLPGRSGEVDDLYVRPECRGRGIERKLLKAAVGALRDRGVGPIFHSDDAKHPEREPWESLGFEADVIRFSLYD